MFPGQLVQFRATTTSKIDIYIWDEEFELHNQALPLMYTDVTCRKIIIFIFVQTEISPKVFLRFVFSSQFDSWSDI